MGELTFNVAPRTRIRTERTLTTHAVRPNNHRMKIENGFVVVGGRVGKAA